MKNFCVILVVAFGFFCSGETVTTGLLCTKEQLSTNCGDTTNAYFTNCCLDGLTCADRPCANCCNKRDSHGFQSCLWDTTSNTCGNFVCSTGLTCSARLNASCCRSKSTCSWQGGRCGKKCPGGRQGNCHLAQTNAGQARDGSCASGYSIASGSSCRYQCHATNGNWSRIRDCHASPCSAPAKQTGCFAFTGINSGQSQTKQCESNYSGSGCSYSCNKGSTTISWNNCRLKRRCTVTASYTGCPLAGTKNHGWSGSYNCSSGYTGTCTGRCNDGALAVTNSCTRRYRDCYKRVCLIYGSDGYFRAERDCWTKTYPHGQTTGTCLCSSVWAIQQDRAYCHDGTLTRRCSCNYGGGGGGSGGCFISDTLITMFNGNKKPIQDIVKGDQVLGQSGINIVTEVKKHYARPFSGLVYSINGSRSFVTGGHPFMTTQGWKAFNVQTAKRLNPALDIQPLKIGDILLKENGKQEVLRDYKSEYQDTKIYNFTVDGDKTYYADGWLVHNK